MSQCETTTKTHLVFFKVGATEPEIGYKWSGQDLTGKTVLVHFRRPDGSEFTIVPTIDDAVFGVFHTNFDATHLTLPGVYAVEVQLTDGADELFSDTFNLRVEERI